MPIFVYLCRFLEAKKKGWSGKRKLIGTNWKKIILIRSNLFLKLIFMSIFVYLCRFLEAKEKDGRGKRKLIGTNWKKIF